MIAPLPTTAVRRFGSPAILASLLTLCTLARAGSATADRGLVAGVAVDRIRVTAGGWQELWVSVRDGEGMPVGGLGRADFSVEEDRRPVGDLQVGAWSDLQRTLDLSIILDPGLLSGPNRADIGALLRGLSAGLPSGTRLRLVSAGSGGGSLEGRADQVQELIARAEDLERGRGGARLYDALFAEVRRAVRLPREEGGAALVVTQRGDDGSRHGLADVLAQSEVRGRRVPILVITVGARAGEDASRLEMLGARSGGAAEQATDVASVPAVAQQLASLAQAGYRLRFRPGEWNAAIDRHTLRVRVGQGERSRETTQEFSTREVTERPWWQAPQTWLWVGVLALGVAGAWLGSRRRRLCALVQDAGPSQGCWFEVFGTPLTLGAADGNDIVLDEPQVSRNHAVIERRGRGIEIVDLNSGNGTFVNDEPVSRRLLADGDVIRLGDRVELSYRTER